MPPRPPVSACASTFKLQCVLGVGLVLTSLLGRARASTAPADVDVDPYARGIRVANFYPGAIDVFWLGTNGAEDAEGGVHVGEVALGSSLEQETYVGHVFEARSRSDSSPISRFVVPTHEQDLNAEAQAPFVFHVVESPPQETNAPPGAFGAHAAPACCIAEGASSMDAETFYAEHLVPNQPLIMRGAVKDDPAFSKWRSDAYVQKAAGLGGGVGETMVEPKWEFLMRGVGSGRKGLPSRKDGRFFSRYLEEDNHEYLFTPVARTDMAKDLLVPAILRAAVYTQDVVNINIWMSGGNTSGVAHFDLYDNWNCQIDGHKTILLVPPSHVRTLLGSHIPRTHIDTESFDAARHPELAAAPFYAVKLAPGDCVYIPTLWMHQIRSRAGERNLNANVWFSPWMAAGTDDGPAPPSDQTNLESGHRSGVRWMAWSDEKYDAAVAAFKGGTGPHAFELMQGDLARAIARSQEALRTAPAPGLGGSVPAGTTFHELTDGGKHCMRKRG